MKFNFKLQKVLEHRKIVEDLAQKDFQEAANQLKFEVENLEKLKISRVKAFETRFDLQSQGISSDRKNFHTGYGPGAFVQIEEFIKGQDRRIESQKAKVQEAENLVESKRDFLRQKATEYKIIEKLKEKQKQEFVEEKERAEQKEIDELNVIRFDRKHEDP